MVVSCGYLHFTLRFLASIDLENTPSTRLDRSIDLLEAVETSWATFDDLGKVVLAKLFSRAHLHKTNRTCSN